MTFEPSFHQFEQIQQSQSQQQSQDQDQVEDGDWGDFTSSS